MEMDFIKKSLDTDLVTPLKCWDFLSMHLSDLADSGKRKQELDTLKKYQDRHQWKVNLNAILERPYEALVLTNPNILIQWVSDGFTKMTGYEKSEVLGKNPNLLHGENTSSISKRRVQKNLFNQDLFTEDLVNYRKNGEEYICRIEIYPIINVANKLCHYLALEREIK